VRLARLSLTAKNGVDRLRGQGIEPDADDIAAIHELGKRLENPEGLPGLSVLGNPIRAGNCTLWPWSIGAERWYYRRALPWFEDLPEVQLYAIAFSLYYSHKPEVLVDIVDMKEAKKAIQLWASHCGATRNELASAIDKLMPDDIDPPKKEDVFCPECARKMPAEDVDQDEDNLPDDLDETSFMDICEILIKAYPGTTLEDWLWSTPKALSLRFLERHVPQGAQEEVDSAKPLMRATHRFETGLRMIRDKHLARRAREEKEGT